MQQINQAEFDKLLTEKDFFAIYISASWCGPCQAFGPVMAELAETFPIYKVDATADRGICLKYGVRSVPTTILIKNGEEVAKKVGVGTKQEIEDLLNTHQ